MDERLRSVEREARGGDAASRARLLAHRLRAGALELRRVQLAAFLDLEEAKMVCSEGLPKVRCGCQDRVGLNEPRPSCYRCAGTGTRATTYDLPGAVRELGEEIGPEVLSRWVRECYTHVRHLVDCHEARLGPAHITPDRAANAASWCYRASGHLLSERQWQRRRLGELIVGI